MTMMRSISLLLAVAALSPVALLGAKGETPPRGASETPPRQEPLKREEIVQLSEAFGHFIGRNISSGGVEFDLEAIIRGMREGAAGKPAPLSDGDYQAMMGRLQQQAFTQLAESNLKAAGRFMEENRAKEGIVEIEHGKLQYKVLRRGDGPLVAEDGIPEIHYRGQYLDGTVFSSSQELGGPITLPLEQTIPGFRRGIAGMREGEKRMLYVHPDLAYGTSGQLPPNALLLFEIEVIKASSDKTKGDEEGIYPFDEDEEDDAFDEDEEENDEDEEEGVGGVRRR